MTAVPTPIDNTHTTLKTRAILGLCLALVGLVCVGCGTTTSSNRLAYDDSLKIDRVFLAQKHVLEPDAPTFGLIGNLEALIKVQIYADKPTASPEAFAILELDGASRELPLRGPTVLPKPPTGEPALMTHSFDDSFTAFIPKEWVKAGLKVTVELRRYNYRDAAAKEPMRVLDRKTVDNLRIGAPSVMVLTMFDVHFFGLEKDADYPRGWLKELEAKLAVSKIDLRRSRTNYFNTLVMPPRGGKPATRCSSEAEYLKKTGIKFDGEQGVSLRWNSALKRAAGLNGARSHYFLNIAGVHSGGQAGGFRGVGNLKRPGVLIHELGHAFGLPHWANRKSYPYTGHMFGVKSSSETSPHAGPNWAFDLNRRAFIPAIVQQDTERGKKGEWKRDPMAGGGFGDQEDGFIFRHFSDYSVKRMRDFMEKHAVVWNKSLGKYARWNQETRSYSTVVEGGGLAFPVKRDTQVISLLVTASLVTPEANIIYAPIGPYKAGLADVFDASSPKDLERAKTCGYTKGRCDVVLQVTQGRVVKNYLIPIKLTVDADPLKEFNVAAVNVPAENGKVTRMALLHVPELMTDGMKGETKTLFMWNPKAEETPAGE